MTVVHIGRRSARQSLAVAIEQYRGLNRQTAGVVNLLATLDGTGVDRVVDLFESLVLKSEVPALFAVLNLDLEYPIGNVVLELHITAADRRNLERAGGPRQAIDNEGRVVDLVHQRKEPGLGGRDILFNRDMQPAVVDFGRGEKRLARRGADWDLAADTGRPGSARLRTGVRAGSVEQRHFCDLFAELRGPPTDLGGPQKRIRLLFRGVFLGVVSETAALIDARIRDAQRSQQGRFPLPLERLRQGPRIIGMRRPGSGHLGVLLDRRR